MRSIDNFENRAVAARGGLPFRYGTVSPSYAEWTGPILESISTRGGLKTIRFDTVGATQAHLRLRW